MTLVVHCKRAPFDVYIGRAMSSQGFNASKWGNPFKIGRDGTRAEVIAKYEAHLRSRPDLMAALPELRGKVLGCWCAPDPCHGDVLARLANAPLPGYVLTPNSVEWRKDNPPWITPPWEVVWPGGAP